MKKHECKDDWATHQNGDTDYVVDHVAWALKEIGKDIFDACSQSDLMYTVISAVRCYDSCKNKDDLINRCGCPFVNRENPLTAFER